MYKESPISFMMKSKVDPYNDQKNRIETFLRFAEEYISILEAVNSQSNSLKFTRSFSINLDVLYYFQLEVGWYVDPDAIFDEAFDTIYTPFAWGSVTIAVNGTTWPAYGGG